MTDSYEKIVSNLKENNTVDVPLLSKIDDAKAMINYISAQNLTLDHWRKLILTICETDLSNMFQDVAQHFLKEEVDKKSASKADDEEKKLMLINTIAAYYLIQASKTLEKSKRDELFGEVMRCTSKSDTINMLHSSLFVLKGYYLFYQGTFDQAMNYFDNGREYHPKKQCVTAYIGQACVEYCKKNYREALKLLKTAFRFNPKAPAKLKIALGYCFYILNKIKLAQKAFEYALESEPNDSEAYLGVALIHKRKNNYNAYFENLEKSFSLKRDNVPVLLELAEHFLYKEDFAKAKKLGLHGLKLLNKSPTIVMEKGKLMGLKVDYYEIKSRLNYVVASCYHQAANYESALKHYNIAVNLYSNNFQAQFGLGQIHINDRNWQEALVCFEYIVKNCADSEIGECYRMLGYLYSKKAAKEETIQYYEKAIKYDNKDYECMLEYASYLEPLDPEKALSLYLNAVNIIKTTNSQMSDSGREIFLNPEILLNIAVLRHKKGDLDKAHEELKSLLETVEKYSEENVNEKSDKYKGMRQTIMYDLAIVLEDKGIFFEAIDLYTQILEENPLYLDAYLRLSFLALNRGQRKRAEELAHQYMEKTDQVIRGTRNEKLKGKFVDGVCLQGYILAEAGSFPKAARLFGQVRDKYSYEDPYAKLAQAVMYYYTSLDYREAPPDQKKYLKSVGEIAKTVLLNDETNFFAGMLMGVTLAETNRLSDAKDVFNLLLESCTQNKSVMLNLAMLEILNRRFDLAIVTFTNYLKKSKVCDPYTEMSLALCYLMTKKYKEAKRILQKLVLKYPESLAYRYNLCASYYEEALEVLKQEQRAIENTKEGVKYLKIIQSQLEYLMASNKSKLSRLMLEETNERKTAKEKESDRIRELSSDKFYWITTNFDTFMERLKHDEQLQKKKEQPVVEERKRISFKEEQERQKAKALELQRQKDRELEERALRLMESVQSEQLRVLQEKQKREREKMERSEKIKKREGGRGDGGRRKKKGRDESGGQADFIYDEGEEEEQEDQEDNDEEEGNYGYNEIFDEEEDGQRRRDKKAKKRLNKLMKKKGRTSEGEGEGEGEGEDEDVPVDYEDEVEEPKPNKTRKLKKIHKKRNLESDDEEQNMVYKSGDEAENKDEDGMEEEEPAVQRSEEGEPEEPPVEREDEEEGGVEEEKPRSEGNDEEHYM